jgi:hypothetical protein
MRHLLIAAALGLLASAAGAQTVDVGRADWKALPPLRVSNEALPMSRLVDRIEEMLRTRECRLPGQSDRRFDITVPYAVHLNPDGTTDHVVVAEMGCPPLETMVGRLVIERSKLGYLVPSGESRPRWYGDELSFVLQ